MTDDLTPERMAAHRVVSRLDIAFELSSAWEARTGWRLPKQPVDSQAIRDMRSLGMVEAAGDNPPPEARAAGLGYHLSAFGLMVRRELLERVKT